MTQSHKYNPEVHHRRSIRLRDYDYRQSGAYFITICTVQHQFLLGDINDDAMYLNDCGKIAAESWEWLSEHYNYVDLGAWVVMPNHFHGILIMRDIPGSETGSLDASASQRKPLGRLMGAFKTISTKRINAFRNTPGEPFWQRDYYEHIIRNLREFDFISEYIANNPTTWAQDKNNPVNLNL